MAAMEKGIFLRPSMAAPLPSLPPDFDQRLLRELRRGSQPLDRYGRILLTGYGLTSVVHPQWSCAVKASIGGLYRR